MHRELARLAPHELAHGREGHVEREDGVVAQDLEKLLGLRALALPLPLRLRLLNLYHHHHLSNSLFSSGKSSSSRSHKDPDTRASLARLL